MKTVTSILQQGAFKFYTVTGHGIEFKPNTPRAEWLEAMQRLCAMFEGAEMTKQRSLMLLADAANYGESEYGEEFAQAIEGMRQALGLTPKTVANAQSAYKRIEASRRRDGLTLGHYSVIAPLLPAEQDQFISLVTADPKHTLTVAELKTEVAIVHPETKRGTKRKVKEKPAEESSETVLQKLIDASNWFSEHEPIEKMKAPLSKLHLAYRRKWRQ